MIIDGARIEGFLTDKGLVIVLKSEEEWMLAARWAMNGSGVSCKLVLQSEEGSFRPLPLENLDYGRSPVLTELIRNGGTSP